MPTSPRWLSSLQTTSRTPKQKSFCRTRLSSTIGLTYPESPTKPPHKGKGRSAPVHTSRTRQRSRLRWKIKRFRPRRTVGGTGLKRRPYGTLLKNLIGFPFNGFTYCLTLFSKFFASFPHGTCSLSVSCRYLALDGVYHPLNTALSSSATRRGGITKGCAGATLDGALTLRGSLFQGI